MIVRRHPMNEHHGQRALHRPYQQALYASMFVGDASSLVGGTWQCGELKYEEPLDTRFIHQPTKNPVDCYRRG